MSLLVKSEFLTLQAAPETTLGVQATAGWKQLQVNPGGLKDFYPQLVVVERSPLSKNLQDEKGSVVGHSSLPGISHDANKDLIEFFQTGIFRSLVKTPSSTGTGKFSPSAVTSTAYTVAAGGALIAGTLLWAQGFTNAANNGLKVVGASSGAASIPVTGLVIETPPATATVEVCGYQGASADIGVNASGQLTSTANVFASLNLQVGMWMWVGGGTLAAPGTLGFTVAAQNRGFTRITSVAAGIIGTDRKNQAWGTDPGTGKTIQLFFGPWLRNVAGDHADYIEPSFTLELSEPGAAAAGATDYLYGRGNAVNTFELNAPAEDKVVASIGFVGMIMDDPTTARATGAAAAVVPINTTALTTASEVRRLRISNVDETGVSTDIMEWKLSVMNNVKAQKQQGTEGAARLIFGKFQVALEVKCVFVQDDVCKAIRDFRTCAFDVALRNAAGAGYLFDVGAVTLRGGAPDAQANEAVTLSTSVKGHRDPTYSQTMGMQHFPFLPAT